MFISVAVCIKWNLCVSRKAKKQFGNKFVHRSNSNVAITFFFSLLFYFSLCILGSHSVLYITGNFSRANKHYDWWPTTFNQERYATRCA